MKKPDFEVDCGFCGKTFVVRRKTYLDCRRRNPEWIFYCSDGCRVAKAKTGKLINCEACGREVYRPAHELEEARFCSHSCAASMTNQERVVEKGKTKTLTCSKCGCEYVGSIRISASNAVCDQCYDHREYSCIGCGAQIYGSRGGKKYCDACRTQVMSSSLQQRVENGTLFSKSIKCEYPFKDSKIRCDSKLEYVCLLYFQSTFDVADMKRSSLVIPYVFKDKTKKYYPDFEVVLTDGTKYLVECKGVVGKKLSDKWHDYNAKALEKKKVLTQWCAENGFTPFWFDQQRHNRIYKSTSIDA